MATVVPNHQAANRRISMENFARVRDVILKSGMKGLQLMEIARACNFSKPTATRWIRSLEDAGIIERSSATGHSVRYGAPGIWAAHEHIRQKTAYEREKYGKSWECHQQLEAWANHVPVHAVVPANEAPKLEKRGPASVWELAA